MDHICKYNESGIIFVLYLFYSMVLSAACCLNRRAPFDQESNQEHSVLRSILTQGAVSRAHAALEVLCTLFGFGSPPVLLLVLKATNTILSGSAALLLVHPGLFDAKDLNFYTANEGDNPTLRYFLESCGYEAVPAHADVVRTFYSDSVRSILAYRRVVGSVSTHVSVVFVYPPTPVAAVVEFHSTLVMNYLSWYGMVVLYPELTLFRQGVVIQGDSPSLRGCVAEYERRGFHFLTPMVPSLRGERSLQDDGVLILSFRGESEDVRSLVEEFEWSLDYDYY